jgi:uncharacterized repeat protein (TIGR01451 family)
VSLSASPSSNLVPGEAITFTVTVTNLGPEPAQYLVLQSSLYTSEYTGFVSDPSECYIFGSVLDGATPAYYVNWSIANVIGIPGSPAFGVGETKTCHLRTSLTSSAPLVGTFSFTVPTYFIDLNPINDTGVVTLTRALPPPKPVPATSLLVLALLAGLLLSGGAYRIRKQRLS